MATMDVQEALELLEHHNKWRRGADIPMLNPTVLGEVIDLVVKTFKKKDKYGKERKTKGTSRQVGENS